MAIADILTPDYIRATYGHGIDFTDDAGNPIPDAAWEAARDMAAELVETELGIRLALVEVTERYDVLDVSPSSHFLTRLRQRPAREVTELWFQYGDLQGFDIPLSWGHLRPGDLFQLIPGREGVRGPLLSHLYPFFAGMPVTPGALKITYRAGFDGDTYPFPPGVLFLLSYLTMALPLDIAGDLIVGAGIASYSVSFDGLSTSIGTTSSATNAGYGARILSMQKQAERITAGLRAKYRGFEVGVL